MQLECGTFVYNIPSITKRYLEKLHLVSNNLSLIEILQFLKYIIVSVLKTL